jgi:hypothetical protein
VPPGSDQPLYFPTKVGAKWVYGGYAEVTLVVTAVEEKGGVLFVDVGEVADGGKVVPYERMAVSSRGLCRVVNLGMACDHTVLRLPWRPGDKWDAWESEGRQWLVVTAGRPERVVTPAGAFEAVRTDWDWRFAPGGPESFKYSEWYAPGIGLVKKVFAGEDAPRTVLKSFTPGK